MARAAKRSLQNRRRRAAASWRMFAWLGKKEADLAGSRCIRLVKLRTGVVLGPNGGALAKMLPPFKAGMGGKLGHGDQWMS